VPHQEHALCRLDESHLTGEADDVLKDTETAPVLFSGSRVLEGMGRCVIIAVGPNSAQGQISGMVAGVETSGDELRSMGEPECSKPLVAGR
jgi:magnesium-transporting ATPase (P-type)